MKTSIFLTIIFVLLLSRTSAADEHSLAGAWEKMKHTEIFKDSTASWDISDTVTIRKVYSNSFVSYILQRASGKNSVFHFSAYTVNGDTYTEKLILHSVQDYIGYEWISKIELAENTMILTHQQSDSVTYVEEWTKID